MLVSEWATATTRATGLLELSCTSCSGGLGFKGYVMGDLGYKWYAMKRMLRRSMKMFAQDSIIRNDGPGHVDKHLASSTLLQRYGQTNCSCLSLEGADGNM